MNTPERPQEHPDTPTPDPAVHPSHAPNGVPEGVEDADAAALPDTGRKESETAGRG